MQKLPNTTIVLIASGHNKTAFPAICRLHACVDKYEVVDYSKVPSDIAAKTTTGAFLDWLLASRADKVFGTTYSTWFWGVFTYRAQFHKRRDPKIYRWAIDYGLRKP